MKIQFPNDQGAAWDAYKILAGSYDIGWLKFTMTPVVLDIGANVGAFSMWAMRKWPGCKITAYEPNQDLEEFFVANTSGQVPLVQKAISLSSPVKYYKKPGNAHVNSLIKCDWHSEETEVEGIHPKDLPECNILKVDTEGYEPQIVSHYPHKPELILLEAHSEKHRKGIEMMLDLNYELVGCEMWARGVAEMKFLRRDVASTLP